MNNFVLNYIFKWKFLFKKMSIWLPMKDCWCNIINGDLVCRETQSMSTLGSNATIWLWPWATLLPRGDIGRIALHTGHHFNN